MEASLCATIFKLKLAEHTCAEGVQRITELIGAQCIGIMWRGRLVITLPGRELSAPFCVPYRDFPKT